PVVASVAPGSSVHNFAAEKAVDVSAKGQGPVSNLWVIDGRNVTSAIRQGVLNLVPNPDLIQETTNQVNTYTSEFGVASGLQVTMTTKSGSDTFHGLASNYFNYQPMYAKNFLSGSAKSYSPFLNKNLSGNIDRPSNT